MRKLAIGVTCVAVVLLGSACGDDGSDSTSPPTTEDDGRPCEPVGGELEASATESIAVELSDYKIDLDRTQVPAGIVTFDVDNNGTEDHELAFIPGGGEVPMTPAGAPDEDALEAMGAFELEAFGPGKSCTATYELEAGTYTLFCIVESPDGATHHQKGMVASLTVT
jgi:plastocyanin